jgi:excisionase family DNA binding protein
MFSVQIKCAVNGREVSLERFATQFFEETMRRVIDEALPKLARVENRGPIQQPLPQKPQAKPRVVSVEEAARTIGLKPSTIRAWIGARKFGSVHLGRRVMIPMEEIDDLLERGLIPARKQVWSEHIRNRQ